MWFSVTVVLRVWYGICEMCACRSPNEFDRDFVPPAPPLPSHTPKALTVARLVASSVAITDSTSQVEALFRSLVHMSRWLSLSAAAMLFFSLSLPCFLFSYTPSGQFCFMAICWNARQLTSTAQVHSLQVETKFNRACVRACDESGQRGREHKSEA